MTFYTRDERQSAVLVGAQSASADTLQDVGVKVVERLGPLFDREAKGVNAVCRSQRLFL
ncbi:MAG: hypothetical protein ACRDJ9_06235 [Dehalococcoidia bacterium]